MPSVRSLCGRLRELTRSLWAPPARGLPRDCAATGGLAAQSYMLSGDKVMRQRLPRQICPGRSIAPYSETAALGTDWLRRLSERRKVRRPQRRRLYGRAPCISGVNVTLAIAPGLPGGGEP